MLLPLTVSIKALICIVYYLICAEKSGDFNLVNYTYSSGVYHEKKSKIFTRQNLKLKP